jgi:hypothetical protein
MMLARCLLSLLWSAVRPYAAASLFWSRPHPLTHAQPLAARCDLPLSKPRRLVYPLFRMSLSSLGSGSQVPHIPHADRGVPWTPLLVELWSCNSLPRAMTPSRTPILFCW